MFLNYFKWNKVLKKCINSNEIYRRHFSALVKCCSINSTLFNQIAANPDFVQPHNRRDFIGFVPDRKDGYGKSKDLSKKEHIKFGLKQLKTELKLWTEEMKETIRGDPILLLPPGLLLYDHFFEGYFDFLTFFFSVLLLFWLRSGETDPVFEFGKQQDIDKFVVTSDSDNNEGFSHCSLKKSEAGYGLFSGVLDSTVPKHGNLSRAGYCNITSHRVKVLFGDSVSSTQ